MGEKERTPRQILRYKNLTFQHLLLCKIVIGNYTESTNLTRRKFDGKYFHGLFHHNRMQILLISGMATNCENEERTFNTLKSIRSNTTNYHPGHIIGNMIIRLQAREKIEGESITQSEKARFLN